MQRIWLVVLAIGMIGLTGCGFSQVQAETEAIPEGNAEPAQMINIGVPQPEIAVLVIPGFSSNGCMGLVPCEVHVKVNEVVDVAFSYVVPNFCFPTYGAPMCKPRVDIGLPSDGLRVGHGGMRSGHFMVTPQFSAHEPGEHFISVQYTMTQNNWFKPDYSGSTVLKVIATE